MRRNDQFVEWCGTSDATGNMVSDALETDGKTLSKSENDGEYAAENEDDDECDEISIVSSSDSQIECDSGGAVVLSNGQERPPCFQNIEVTNSSDVHFGNKTYYQGPVTIKQILYTNPQNNESEETQNSDNKLPITDINRGDTANNVFIIPDTANGIVKNSNINNINCNNLSSNWTEKNKGKRWLQRRTSKQLIIGTAILILIMVAIITLTIALLTKYSPTEEHKSGQHFESESDIDKPNNDPEAIVNIIRRRIWVAEPPFKTTPLKVPVSKVIFVETRTEICTSRGDCVFTVRHLQTAHKEGSSNWDIKYNFLIGGDGNVYEGRGWITQGSTVPECNENSLQIAFIGTFKYDIPPDKQVKAAQRLLKMGVNRNYIKPDYKFALGSRLLGEDEDSPNELEQILETWPHWSNGSYFCNS